MFIESPMEDWPLDELYELRIQGAGMLELSGLESAVNLQRLYAGSNSIADLSPLQGMFKLAGLDLRNNRIADIAALAANASFSDDELLIASQRQPWPCEASVTIEAFGNDKQAESLTFAVELSDCELWKQD